MLAERSLPPEAWCEVVGALELGLNTAVSDSTGKPPALVALGEMPRLPVDLIVGDRVTRGGPECSHTGEGHSGGSTEAAGEGIGVPEEVL